MLLKRLLVAGTALMTLSATVLFGTPTLPLAGAAAPARHHGGVVTNYIGTGIDEPGGITSGPDGALWFTNPGNDSIGRIATNGTVTNYTGVGIDQPVGITSGPDGALWFTNWGNNSLGRITTSGVVSNFTGAGVDMPYGITAGPDGALWFTNETDPGSIGPSRQREWCPTSQDRDANTSEITTGPDGALWFTNVNNDSIGRITISGVVSNFPGTGSEPLGIVSGPDGALWFTNSDSNSIGRITTAGVMSDYVGTGIEFPISIVSGADGALWFTNANSNSIGRITTAGAVANYTGPGIYFPYGITAGSDGALWFTNRTYPGSIGRITSVPEVSVSPASGAPGKTVAVSGTGYSSGEQVNVTYTNGLANRDPAKITICSAIVGTDGTFKCLGHIPPSSVAGAIGDHSVRATGKTTLATAKTTFNLT